MAHQIPKFMIAEVNFFQIPPQMRKKLNMRNIYLLYILIHFGRYTHKKVKPIFLNKLIC